MIQSLARSALDDGYSALAITEKSAGCWIMMMGELIIEYEWKLNDYVFHQYPVSALCRYNITKFTDEMIRNIIQLHPIIIWQYKFTKIIYIRRRIQT
jgi:N-acetylmuramoyl-L-alanine amidase CwlA